MRQIKYRVWDGATMHEVQTLCFSPGGVMWFGEGRLNGYASVNPDFPWGGEHQPPAKIDHLMAYTGLKDKNGREIWEGDVVTSGPLRQYMGPIVYQDHGFVTLLKTMAGDHSVADRDWSHRDHLTVLGDIYRNPDLLK